MVRSRPEAGSGAHFCLKIPSFSGICAESARFSRSEHAVSAVKRAKKTNAEQSGDLWRWSWYVHDIKKKEDVMSYREDHYTPTGTHPVGAHTPPGGSRWGLAVVLIILLGLLGLAMMVGPSDERGDGVSAPDATAPAVEQSAPAIEQQAPTAPAPQE